MSTATAQSAPETAQRLTYREFVLFYGTPGFQVTTPVGLKKFDELTGLIFGKLFVEGKITGSANFLGPRWRCVCACFCRTEVYAKHLLNGRVKDCGCRNEYRKLKRRQRRKALRKLASIENGEGCNKTIRDKGPKALN